MISVPFLLIFAMYFLSPVTMDVWPIFAHAPASFRARAIIEKHQDNRLLILEVDGPEYKRSDFAIAGAQSQRVFQWARLELRGSGEYTGTATLIRVTGGKEKRYVATTVFRVIGMEP